MCHAHASITRPSSCNGSNGTSQNKTRAYILPLFPTELPFLGSRNWTLILCCALGDEAVMYAFADERHLRSRVDVDDRRSPAFKVLHGFSLPDPWTSGRCGAVRLLGFVALRSQCS